MSSITVRVPDAQKKKLTAMAKADGRKLSDFIRRQFEMKILPQKGPKKGEAA